jgi:hypothetical protein
MATTVNVGRFLRHKLAWATGAGIVACGLACTLPALVVVAAGTGAGASAAAYLPCCSELTAGFAAFLGTLATLVVVAKWRARKMKTMSTGCGCSSTKEIYRSPKAEENVPIACTADLQDKVSIQQQMDGYREAFEHLVRTERVPPNGLTWTFRAVPGLADRLRTLASNEYRCCSFFTFDVRASDSGNELLWTLSAPDDARAIVDAFAELPERLQGGADTNQIKELVKNAGLEFVADR